MSALLDSVRDQKRRAGRIHHPVVEPTPPPAEPPNPAAYPDAPSYLRARAAWYREREGIR